ncbi:MULTISPECIES: trimeric intracellular cation channel family protein [Cupriavidus]|uniref:trimeric intracellular cation channel family protein n=1 Tax=Cupriavidus sp. WS TaxID=1312922 RepID=UPI00039A7701|nr:TRIC cation channel family protein [Cupriavidus sp. WS]
MRTKAEVVVLAADLAGTAVFALEGAITGMQHGLDLLGVMVVSLITAVGGGIIRDLLIGAAPPNAIRDWRYPALAMLTGAAAFVFHSAARDFAGMLPTMLDAAGLSLFAVAGAQKARLYGVRPFIATLMGAVTGVGGGVVRDMLLARVPVVLHADIYATAAWLGATVAVSTRALGLPPVAAAVAGGGACFVLRLLAVWNDWHLPTAPVW